LWSRVGIAKAKELALLGTQIAAAEALRIGLVSRIVPVDRLLPEALEVARELAAKPSATARAIKTASRRIATLELLAGMDLEAELAAAALRDAENISRAAAHLATLKNKKA